MEQFKEFVVKYFKIIVVVLSDKQSCIAIIQPFSSYL